MDIPVPHHQARSMAAPSDVDTPHFTDAQIAWLRKRYPVLILPHDTPLSRIHQYFGERRVLDTIERQRAGGIARKSR